MHALATDWREDQAVANQIATCRVLIFASQIALSNEKAPRRHRRRAFLNSAERGGFEPPDPFGEVTALAMLRIRPLCHLSGFRLPAISCQPTTATHRPQPGVDATKSPKVHSLANFPRFTPPGENRLLPERSLLNPPNLASHPASLTC